MMQLRARHDRCIVEAAARCGRVSGSWRHDGVARWRDLRGRRCHAAVRGCVSLAEARLRDLRRAESCQGQCHPLPDLVQRAAHRHRMADWARRRARPLALFHRHSEPAGQRPVLLAVQHRRAVSRGDLSRCRRGPAPAPRRAFRHLEAGPGLWLVDGRHAGLSLGGAASRHGRARCRGLRQRALRALQLRLPRKRQGRAHRRSRLPRRALRGEARRRLSRHGARLCRLGDVARLLPRRTLARSGLRLAGGLSRPYLGRDVRPARRQ